MAGNGVYLLIARWPLYTFAGWLFLSVADSGAGTNLKVGAHVRREAREFFVVPLHFLALQARFDERFCDGQYSLVSFLFAVLLLTVPPHAQSFVKVGDMCPRALRNRRHLWTVCNLLCSPAPKEAETKQQKTPRLLKHRY